MIDVHLYGKLRRFAPNGDPHSDSVVSLPHWEGDTVGSVVARRGIPDADLGANLFVDGHYADRGTSVHDGARVGLFPDDMQLLYKWYFRPPETGP
jgi:hypothetical protein